MPDPSSSDDHFAELLGRLPDPQSRSAQTPSAPPATPTSRRAARQAAAVEPAPSPASGDSASAASAPPAPAEPSSPEAGSAAPEQLPNAPTSAATASASLDDLFSGAATSDDLGDVPRANRRRRRIAGWVAFGIVLALIGGIAGAGFWAWNTYEEPIREFMGWTEPKDYSEGEATGEAFVTVVSGDTGQTISQSLYDAGVTRTADAFYDMLIQTQQNPPFVPGVFRLQQRMTSAAALTALLDPANKMSNTAQLREGLTVDQSLPILAEGLQLPLEDFQAAVANPADYGVSASSLEGWLFPATYTFDPGMTAADVIRTLVNRTIESLDAASVPVERRQEILTIAAIIQREARFSDDFYKVSRVIQNRLDPSNDETFGLLQMDSTAQYGYGELHDGTVSSSGEALTDDNPWNTYVHPGLPAGPIANPGDLAIDAAMHPADGPWLYFVTVNLDTGETVFTTTITEHNAAVRQWQNWCSENPDAGC